MLTAGKWQEQTDGGAGGAVTYAVKPHRDRCFFQDDFIHGIVASGDLGDRGWTINAIGGTAYVAGTADHPGILRLQTDAVATSRPRFHSRSDQFFLDAVEEAGMIVKPQAGSATMFFKCGMTDGVNEDETDQGAYFAFSPGTSANWRTITRDAVSITSNSTDIAYTVGNWYLLQIKRNGSNQEFWINNVLKQTHTTNIPTGVQALMFLIATNEAVAKSIDIDYASLRSLAYGQRWT